VIRPKNLQTTGLGAALLAGLGTGVWRNLEEIRKVWKSDRVYKPRMSAADRERHVERWRRALERA